MKSLRCSQPTEQIIAIVVSNRKTEILDTSACMEFRWPSNNILDIEMELISTSNTDPVSILLISSSKNYKFSSGN